jgi:hypothetical protein
MPRKATIDTARRDKRQGKSASTQAGEFVHDEIDKIRHGEHGARSTKQAIAIGLCGGLLTLGLFLSTPVAGLRRYRRVLFDDRAIANFQAS